MKSREALFSIDSNCISAPHHIQIKGRNESEQTYSGRNTTILVLPALTTAADDPFVGTWKRNMEKSTNRTSKPPKNITDRFDIQGDILRRVEDIIRADGTSRRDELTAILDGRNHPITDNQNLDVYQANRIDSYTVIIVLKKGGKEVLTIRHVVSADGKTMTVTEKGKDDHGQEISYISIYEKQ